MGNQGGDRSKRVNAQSFEIFIDALSDEWLNLQEATLPIGSPVVMEPTTAGTVIPYDSTPRNKLTGVVVYTTDSWADSVAGWTRLLAKTNNERPIFTLIVRFTNASGGTNTLTYTSGAQLESVTPVRGGEGAVKANISIAIFVDPVLS